MKCKYIVKTKLYGEGCGAPRFNQRCPQGITSVAQCDAWNLRLNPKKITHKLKVLSTYYHPLCAGTKTFEIRKNDRNYKCGDVLVMRLWNPVCGFVAGFPPVVKRVCYITGYPIGLKPGFVVLGLEDCEIKKRKANK